MKEKLSPDSENNIRKSNSQSVMSAGDRLYDILGYGYNVNGEYGNSSSTTFQVLDIAALKSGFSGRVEEDLTKLQDARLVSGENAASYTKGLSSHITATFSTGVSLFKQTIKASFNDSSSTDSKYIYASYYHIIKQKTVIESFSCLNPCSF